MIYYVEDNEGIRNLVTYTLNMTGFEAQGFSEGESFFQGHGNGAPGADPAGRDAAGRGRRDHS